MSIFLHFDKQQQSGDVLYRFGALRGPWTHLHLFTVMTLSHASLSTVITPGLFSHAKSCNQEARWSYNKPAQPRWRRGAEADLPSDWFRTFVLKMDLFLMCLNFEQSEVMNSVITCMHFSLPAKQALKCKCNVRIKWERERESGINHAFNVHLHYILNVWRVICVLRYIPSAWKHSERSRPA